MRIFIYKGVELIVIILVSILNCTYFFISIFFTMSGAKLVGVYIFNETKEFYCNQYYIYAIFIILISGIYFYINKSIYFLSKNNILYQLSLLILVLSFLLEIFIFLMFYEYDLHEDNWNCFN